MEESWEDFHLHTDLEFIDNYFTDNCNAVNINGEDFLREILLQTPQSLFCSESENDYSIVNQNGCFTVNDAVKDVGNMVKSNSTNSIVSEQEQEGRGLEKVCLRSPKRYILSFDKSTMIPASVNLDGGNKRNRESEMKKNEEKRVKKGRNGSQCVDHIMAERRRRQELTERFIALSATIPGLSKTDKASILRATIDYVKQLKERVQELEKQDKNCVATSSIMVLNKPNLEINDQEDKKNCGETCFGDDCDNNNNILPEIEVKVMGKEVLLEIHCEKQNGIELKLLNHLQNLQLFVTSSSILPFGKLTISITIIAQMGDGYKMLVNDLVNSLRQVLLKPEIECQSDPY